ncbi:unnamed protein product, partial [Heterosigma akashiwo]
AAEIIARERAEADAKIEALKREMEHQKQVEVQRAVEAKLAQEKAAREAEQREVEGHLAGQMARLREM